ncbi:MAG: hypothetical protein AAF542_07780 [Pseudomonadota bacterium]
MSRTSIQKTIFRTATALLVATTLSACSSNPTERTAYDRQHRPNCELPGESSTSLFVPRQRVVASSAECQDWGGDMLIVAAD